MALSAEQQAEVDKQNAIEDHRATQQLAVQAKMAKVEAVRMAKGVLVENSRSKAVEEREVTAADITAYAEILRAYMND
jgi:hypothetical protein